MPAPPARACDRAAVSSSTWSSCRRRFVSALFRPLSGGLFLGLFCAAGVPVPSGRRSRLSPALGPGAAPAVSSHASAILPLCGGSGGLSINAQAHLARHRESSASANFWARREPMSRSAIRWISMRMHTPQLTPSGCLGVVMTVLSNEAAPLGTSDCSE